MIEQLPQEEKADSTITAVKGAVIYSDGSCKGGNPGNIGWGAHGYIYTLQCTKPHVVDSYVVGSYLHTTRGYLKPNQLIKPSDPSRATAIEAGLEVEPLEYFDFLGSSLSTATNNVAELQATIYSLERLSSYSDEIKHITLKTDSLYVVKGINDHCVNWIKYNWITQDGSHVKNHEWWLRLYTVVQELRARGVEVFIEWVRSHDDILGNVQADILAGIAATYSADQVLHSRYEFQNQRGYWKTEIDRHPFLNFKRIYFNSVPSHNIIGNYFQADSGAADHLLGKRIPETGLAIVKLKQPDLLVEAVKTRQFEIANDLNAIIMMKLDRIFSKEVYPYLSVHGKYALLPGRGKNMNLDFHDREAVTVEVSPTGLSMRTIESFNLLEDLLGRFIEYRQSGFDVPDNNIRLNYHDITDTFYDREERVVRKEILTKYILKPEYVVGFRDLAVSIEETFDAQTVELKIPLILGTDLLPRNNLKKLEDLTPHIYLITWRESKNSIRYATVIECDSGIGIWSNFFADKIFFKPIQPSPRT